MKPGRELDALVAEKVFGVSDEDFFTAFGALIAIMTIGSFALGFLLRGCA